MKKLALISFVVASLGVSGAANAAIDPSTERNLIKICKALKSGSQLQLHKAVKRSRLGYRNIAKGLKCNGQDAFLFALNHNGAKAADYLARRANVERDTMVARAKQ